MKKFNRIFLLLVALIFLTTYSPLEFNSGLVSKSDFFKIRNIQIQNNFLISENMISKELNHIYDKNIFFIKRKELEEPLKNIDFLEKIEVYKKYPDTIIIKIFETKPVAIIFKKKTKFLLDTSSNLISLENIDLVDPYLKLNDIFPRLPSVFGENAEKNFINFLNQLKNSNFPTEKIKDFYYFHSGRWDLKLLSNKIIKFPNTNIQTAIQKTTELLNRKDFESYNIIDLRVDGKIIVE